ncbi:hypothetical protein MNBD_GAMMA25-1287 [hydrothermal vent metagenome]|uniref:Uncharacterized protein n=1 Tax=hydrothermal vent metagenome TaxID=652676 RepID=A0A3B1AUX9_9ZZZZ
MFGGFVPASFKLSHRQKHVLSLTLFFSAALYLGLALATEKQNLFDASRVSTLWFTVLLGLLTALPLSLRRNKF